MFGTVRKGSFKNWRCHCLRINRDFLGEQEEEGKEWVQDKLQDIQQTTAVLTRQGFADNTFKYHISDLLGGHTIPSCLFPPPVPFKLFPRPESPTQITFPTLPLPHIVIHLSPLFCQHLVPLIVMEYTGCILLPTKQQLKYFCYLCKIPH